MLVTQDACDDRGAAAFILSSALVSERHKKAKGGSVAVQHNAFVIGQKNPGEPGLTVQYLWFSTSAHSGQ
jgi:hypothetical protein